MQTRNVVSLQSNSLCDIVFSPFLTLPPTTLALSRALTESVRRACTCVNTPCGVVQAGVIQ